MNLAMGLGLNKQRLNLIKTIKSILFKKGLFEEGFFE